MKKSVVKVQVQKLENPSKSGKLAIIVAVLAFGAVGTALLYSSMAAGSYEAIQAEAGTRSGNVTLLTNETGASNNQAVLFKTPPPPAPNSPSGEAMPVGDIAGWRQVFTEEFTTDMAVGGFAVSGWRQGVASSAYKAKWTGYPADWNDTSDNGWYEQGKIVSISGGVLKKFIHTENGRHLVAAPVPLIPGATGGTELSSGRYVVRFKSDPVPGYKTAWLLWPSSDVWPRDGEIDFPEGDLDGGISAFMHRQNGTSGSDQDYYNANATYSNWHTAVIEWKGGQYCKFILDGVTIGNSTSRVPNTPMHWVLQTETQLSGGPPSDSAQGNLYIDWVTVYVPS